jgi:outer membrane protein TolC
VQTLHADERILTLEAYCAASLSNNTDILSAETNLNVSKELSWVAFTNYFPKITAYGGLVSLNIFQGQLYENVEMFASDIKNTFDLSKHLGGSIGGINISQVVFAGGRIVNTNRLAKKGAEASLYQLAMKKNDIYLQAQQKYFNCLLISKALKTLDMYKETLEFIYKQANEGLTLGVVSKTDALKVAIKKEEVEIKQIELLQQQNLAKKDLMLFANISGDTQTIQTVDSFDTLGKIFEPQADESTFESRLYRRPEYNLLKISADVAHLNELIAIGSYAPEVEGGISFYRTDFFPDSKFFDKSTAYYQDAAGYLLIKLPISSLWEGYYKMREMQALTKDAIAQRDSKQQYLLLDIENKYIAYNTAWRSVRLAELNVEYSDANLSQVKDGYDAGIDSLGDYLQALALDYESKAKLDKAKADYWQAKSAFSFALGE